MTVGALVLLGLYVGRSVLIPLAIAFLISFALNPLVTWVSRRGLPRVAAVSLVLLVVVTLLLGLALVIGSQVRILSQELPTYQSTIRTKIDEFGAQMKGPGVFDGAWETVTTVRREFEHAVGGGEDAAPPTRVEVVSDANAPIRTAIELLLPALAPLATAGIVLVFVFLVLLDQADLRDRLIRMLGGNLHRATDAMEEAGNRISKYLLMQLIVNVTYGLPMALGLWAIGVPGWILWGTLAALMRFVPYVGPMLSAVFPIALAFAVDPGWNMVLLTVGLILLLELISNNIVEPVLYGTSTGLSALSLIAAATFWTALWGPVGLILSTPLTVCLLVIGRNIPRLAFLDTLLGSTPVLDLSTRIYQRLIADDPEEAIEIATDAIEASSVPEFYDEYGIDVLRRASEDFLTRARASHRVRVVAGLDVLFTDLRQEFGGHIDVAARPRVACIGGKWEVDAIACEMLGHALAFHDIAAVQRSGGVVTEQYVDALDLTGIDVVCLSYFSQEPEASVRSFRRRLRRRWPGVRIVLALWSVPDPTAIESRADLGADAVVTSIAEAVLRVEQMLSPDAARERQTPDLSSNESERVAALEASSILDGHASRELDGLAARAAEVLDVEIAVIAVVTADAEIVIGRSAGSLTEDGGALSRALALPGAEGICGHVLAEDQTVEIADTHRDPRFAENAALREWNARFFAGAPLRAPDGLVLGAFCLIGTVPRELAPEELKLLNDMAREAASVIAGETVSEEEPEPVENSATIGQSVPR